MQKSITESQNKAITIFLKLQGTKCNMKCVYCYTHDKAEENRNILCSPQEVTEYLRQYVDYNHIFIVFHGGEPLLYPINDYAIIFEYITTHFYNNIHIQFQTNGTLIDDNWLKLFSKYANILSLSFSIDPDGERDLRVYPTNISKNEVYNNIIKCSDIINNVGIISVAHRYNYAAFNEFIIKLKNMGIHSLTINKYQTNSNWKTDDYYISEMQYTDLLIDTFKFWISKKLYQNINIQPIQSLFSKKRCKICRYMYDNNKCTYFHTFFNEQHKSNLCDHITNNFLPKLPPSCLNCSILNKCGGGCLNEEKDETFCTARKKLFDFIGGYLL